MAGRFSFKGQKGGDVESGETFGKKLLGPIWSRRLFEMFFRKMSMGEKKFEIVDVRYQKGGDGDREVLVLFVKKPAGTRELGWKSETKSLGVFGIKNPHGKDVHPFVLNNMVKSGATRQRQYLNLFKEEASRVGARLNANLKKFTLKAKLAYWTNGTIGFAGIDGDSMELVKR